MMADRDFQRWLNKTHPPIETPAKAELRVTSTLAARREAFRGWREKTNLDQLGLRARVAIGNSMARWSGRLSKTAYLGVGAYMLLMVLDKTGTLKQFADWIDPGALPSDIPETGAIDER